MTLDRMLFAAVIAIILPLLGWWLDRKVSLTRRGYLIIGVALIAAALVLLVAVVSAHAAEPVNGTVLSAGPVYQARQHVCFVRSDVAGRTCLTVSVSAGGTYSRGEAITIHRDCSRGACRLAGLSHR